MTSHPDHPRLTAADESLEALATAANQNLLQKKKIKSHLSPSNGAVHEVKMWQYLKITQFRKYRRNKNNNYVALNRKHCIF